MRYFLLILVGFLSLSQTGLADDSLKVWAFNLRYASNSKPNAWPDRLPVMANLIKKNNPDIIGTQEGKFYQLKELNKQISQYTWFGTGRDGGSRGEFMAIFYKANRFDIMKYDHFWLSDTPDVIASATWGHSNRRMVTWILFRDKKTNKQFYFWNTHFDHRGSTARLESGRLIKRVVMDQPAEIPAVVMGDFNCLQKSPPYLALIDKKLMTDARLLSKQKVVGPDSTWNGFRAIASGRIIDHIFVRGQIEIEQLSTLDPKTSQGRYASDHLPVQIVVHWDQSDVNKN